MVARQCAVLAAFAAITFAAFNIYFVAAAGLRTWWYCGVVTFPPRYYSAPTVNNWRVLQHDFGWHSGPVKWITYPFIYATVPLACVVFLVMTRRRWKDADQPWRDLVLIALTGTLLFIFLPVALAIGKARRFGCTAGHGVAWLAALPFGIDIAAVQTGPGSCSRSFGGGFAVGEPRRTGTRFLIFLRVEPPFMKRPNMRNMPGFLGILTRDNCSQGCLPMCPFHSSIRLRLPAMTRRNTRARSRYPRCCNRCRTHAVPLMILPSEQKYLQPTGLPSDHLVRSTTPLQQLRPRLGLFRAATRCGNRRPTRHSSQ